MVQFSGVRSSPVKVIDLGKLLRYFVNSDGVPLSSGSANAAELLTRIIKQTTSKFLIKISPFYYEYVPPGIFYSLFFIKIQVLPSKIQSYYCVFKEIYAFIQMEGKTIKKNAILLSIVN